MVQKLYLIVRNYLKKTAFVMFLLKLFRIIFVFFIQQCNLFHLYLSQDTNFFWPDLHNPLF